MLSACRQSRRDAIDWPARVSPPFGLATVTSGMPIEDAARALHIAPAGGSDTLPVAGADAYLAIDAQRRVGDIVVTVDTTCRSLAQTLAAKWGAYIAPSPELRSAGASSVPGQPDRHLDVGTGSWIDVETGWEATLVGRDARCVVSFLHRNYFGDKASRPGDLAVIEGKTQQEASKLLDRHGHMQGVREINGDYTVGLGDRVRETSLLLSPTTGKLLESAWGPAAIGAPERWLDTRTKYRAILNKSGAGWTVSYTPYVLPGDWLGDGDAIAALPAPSLGATVEQLANTFGARFVRSQDGKHALLVSASPGDPLEGAAIELEIQAQAVARITIKVPWDENREDLRARAERKWGQGTAIAGGMTFASKAYGTIAVLDSSADLTVILERPSK